MRYADVYTDSEEDEDPMTDRTAKENYYVIVQLSAEKKTVKKYIGLILAVHSDLEYTVKFLRKCGVDKFTFPERDDIFFSYEN